MQAEVRESKFIEICMNDKLQRAKIEKGVNYFNDSKILNGVHLFA